MKTTLLSIVLLAGSAGLVSGAPGKKETTERVSYTEEQRSEDGWVELASPTPSKHGRQFITVDNRSFDQLRIDGHSGRTKVQSVIVHFASGTSREFRVGRYVRPKQSVVVDVPAELIDHVVVVTHRYSGGMYTLHGAPAGGAVATR
ncbi:MAG: hypothetical protein M3680_31960 [Myxococcota bacterium]|nr:hypothetical protein [Myxococcota bacterium]